MTKRILEKMAKTLGRDHDSVSGAVDEELKTVLDEHLDQIAAAHVSVHADHHASTPTPGEGGT